MECGPITTPDFCATDATVARFTIDDHAHGEASSHYVAEHLNSEIRAKNNELKIRFLFKIIMNQRNGRIMNIKNEATGNDPFFSLKARP